MTAGDWIASGALLVAVLALIVSWLERRHRSTYDGRQQALADRLAAVELDRHRAERAPTITAEHTIYAGRDAIEFVNRGPLDLEEVSWSIVDTDQTPAIDGLNEPGVDAVERWGSLSRMTLGTPAVRFVVRSSDADGGDLRFRFTARLGDEEWPLVVDCHLPGTILYRTI